MRKLGACTYLQQLRPGADITDLFEREAKEFDSFSVAELGRAFDLRSTERSHSPSIVSTTVEFFGTAAITSWCKILDPPKLNGIR